MNTFATRSSSCYVAGTGSQRITREERITLRNISIAKKTPAQKVAQVIHKCCEAIISVPARLKYSQKSKLSTSMCKFYGHVIEGPWEGYFPHCRDCGCEITSPDQLRKASPTKVLNR
jgi:hypothetical protein